MPIASMTGFGRSRFSAGEVDYSVEIRSLNHRHLDVRLRLPRQLASCELAVRGQITRRLSRGRVDVTVATAGVDVDVPTQISVNLPLTRALLSAAATLANELGVAPPGLTVPDLLTFPGIVVAEMSEVAREAVEPAVLEGVRTALDTLAIMRQAEGRCLAAELSGRLDRIATLTGQLAEQAPELCAAYRDRLQQRMVDLLGRNGVDVDQGRLLQEVAILADRTDVAEELARLESHVVQARGLLERSVEEGVGRRLDFLCQEMHREANTIGSKVQDVRMTQLVIDTKAELERLREQAQNVE